MTEPSFSWLYGRAPVTCPTCAEPASRLYDGFENTVMKYPRQCAACRNEGRGRERKEAA